MQMLFCCLLFLNALVFVWQGFKNFSKTELCLQNANVVLLFTVSQCSCDFFGRGLRISLRLLGSLYTECRKSTVTIILR
jgi:hypothetical protein